MGEDSKMTFWEHLDVLRDCLVKIVIVTVVVSLAAFCFKQQLFELVFAPKDSGFVTYRWLGKVSSIFLPSQNMFFNVKLINTALANQFLIHMKVATYVGIIIASPYILYQLFCFVSPALYSNERKYTLGVVGSGYLMFMLGVALNYFLIFPLTFRFLGTYQVSADVENLINLDSYVDTMMMMNLLMGIVFEIPVLCWLFAKIGFIDASFLKRYRRHAVVIILIIAAVITPTSDAFTLTVVALPMWLLYEMSIIIVRHTSSVVRHSSSVGQ
jgi:sec-independent protein translocase protein TatC